MSRRMGWAMGGAVAALTLLLAVAVVPAEVVVAGGERIDLSELEDGETRTFGREGHEVTATRAGDEIIITFDGQKMKTFRCTAGQDDCFVVTLEGEDSVKVMVTQGSDDGGTRKEQVIVMGAGANAHAVASDVFVRARGDGDGEFFWVSGEEGVSVGHGAGHAKVLELIGDGQVVLRCPEGDATLTLDEGEDIEGYTCPRHDLPLEKSERRIQIRKLHLNAEDEDL